MKKIFLMGNFLCTILKYKKAKKLMQRQPASNGQNLCSTSTLLYMISKCDFVKVRQKSCPLLNVWSHRQYIKIYSVETIENYLKTELNLVKTNYNLYLCKVWYTFIHVWISNLQRTHYMKWDLQRVKLDYMFIWPCWPH